MLLLSFYCSFTTLSMNGGCKLSLLQCSDLSPNQTCNPHTTASILSDRFLVGTPTSIPTAGEGWSATACSGEARDTVEHSGARLDAGGGGMMAVVRMQGLAQVTPAVSGPPEPEHLLCRSVR